MQLKTSANTSPQQATPNNTPPALTGRLDAATGLKTKPAYTQRDVVRSINKTLHSIR